MKKKNKENKNPKEKKKIPKKIKRLYGIYSPYITEDTFAVFDVSLICQQDVLQFLLCFIFSEVFLSVRIYFAY